MSLYEAGISTKEVSITDMFNGIQKIKMLKFQH